MTTVTAPAWAPWTSYYDSVGQAPGMLAIVAGDGLNVQFKLDRFNLSLQGGQDAPFAGAAGCPAACRWTCPQISAWWASCCWSTATWKRPPGARPR